MKKHITEFAAECAINPCIDYSDIARRFVGGVMMLGKTGSTESNEYTVLRNSARLLKYLEPASHLNKRSGRRKLG